MLPVGTFGCPGVSLPGAVSASVAPTSSSMKVGCASIQASVVQQQATAVVKKRNQMVQIKATDVNNTLLLKPKIQEDLIIAREIVINDADPAMRYKLTKRQTQEEIQKCTGAVVITRGKYRPPNAVPNGEKPLYLHISAGAQLTETVERILAVDRAASMVEDMLKQVSQLLNACIYLGFDADPSLKIASRIHGPNEQRLYFVGVVRGILGILRVKRDTNLYIYCCQVTIKRALKMQNFWLKIFWTQSVKSAVLIGFLPAKSIMSFHLHSSCWLAFRVQA